jgi:hypothetical protein
MARSPVPIQYKDFDLECSILSLGDGRFSAQVLIGRETPVGRLEQFFPGLGIFATEEQAITRAAAWGKSWCDANA